MLRKRLLVTAVMVLFVVASAFSSFAYRPSLGLWSGGAFCIPTAEYLKEYPGDPSVQTPPVRTSFGYGVDADVLQLSYSSGNQAVGVGLGVSYLGVSRSLSYGLSSLKAYSGFGVLGQLDYRYGDLFGITLSYRYLDCSFSGVSQHFLVQEFELSPAYRLGSLGYSDLFVKAPVCISVKADSVTLRLGIGLSIGADSLRAGGPK